MPEQFFNPLLHFIINLHHAVRLEVSGCKKLNPSCAPSVRLMLSFVYLEGGGRGGRKSRHLSRIGIRRHVAR